MRKIMVFQHVSYEPLGTLDPMLKTAGFRIRYVNFSRQPDIVPSLEGYFGLVVLGGPMGVYDAHQIPHLKLEMKLIEEALKKDIPVLGICLGSQLLAQVLGSQVRKGHQWELGWTQLKIEPHGKKDPLFKDWGGAEHIFQLHQDTFDTPKSTEKLATSDNYEGQAFRYGKKVYGLQFHLEADQPMILRWLHRPENQKLTADLKLGSSVQKETEKYISRSLELSQSTFGKFIELFNLPARPILLGSKN